jgi:hypothetical protein
MSQELTQDQKNFSGSTTIRGTTGGTCSVSGLYKATDGRIEFIQPFVVGDKFFAFPGGTGKSKCTWTLMSKSSDGNRTSYTAVKVEAGAL